MAILVNSFRGVWVLVALALLWFVLCPDAASNKDLQWINNSSSVILASIILWKNAFRPAFFMAFCKSQKAPAASKQKIDDDRQAPLAAPIKPQQTDATPPRLPASPAPQAPSTPPQQRVKPQAQQSAGSRPAQQPAKLKLPPLPLEDVNSIILQGLLASNLERSVYVNLTPRGHSAKQAIHIDSKTCNAKGHEDERTLLRHPAARTDIQKASARQFCVSCLKREGLCHITDTYRGLLVGMFGDCTNIIAEFQTQLQAAYKDLPAQNKALVDADVRRVLKACTACS